MPNFSPIKVWCYKEKCYQVYTRDPMYKDPGWDLWPSLMCTGPRSSRVLWEEGDHCRRETRRVVQPWASTNVQACDQACSSIETTWVMHGCTQGGVHKVTDKSTQGEETCGEKVVLHSNRRVRIDRQQQLGRASWAVSSKMCQSRGIWSVWPKLWPVWVSLWSMCAYMSR